MKLFKKGFTLAELLLSFAIIGVITAMGMTVTKKTTDKAYDLYYYTGFVNLYNAMADAVANEKQTYQDLIFGDVCSDHQEYMCIDSDVVLDKYPIDTDLVQHVIKYFDLDATTVGNESSNEHAVLRTPNGIVYTFYNLYNSSLDNNVIPIMMTIPRQKSRSNPNGAINVPLKFFDVSLDGIRTFLLLPDVAPEYNDANGNTGNTLLNRRDLLPVYIDDGIVGRNRRTNEFRPINYFSYREAFCRNRLNLVSGRRNFVVAYRDEGSHTSPHYDEGSGDAEVTHINCAGLGLQDTADLSYKPGVLRFADPRKIK